MEGSATDYTEESAAKTLFKHKGHNPQGASRRQRRKFEGNEHGWIPTFRRVPFDHKAVFREFEKSGYNRECGPIGRLLVEIYRKARPMFGFLRWRDVHKPSAPITDELMDEYLATVNWWEYSHPAYHINME